jgi:alanine-glyoxylate transaminase / serine-glyoxylate transaminase / serine-pyruvate transaminase
MPKDHDAEAIRYTLSPPLQHRTGRRAWRIGGKVCRIGRLGDLNEPMLLGALTAGKIALRTNHAPHDGGNVYAAMDVLSAQNGREVAAIPDGD